MRRWPPARPYGRVVGSVAVVGANGTIGRHLCAALSDAGREVVPVCRRPQRVAGIEAVVWDPDVAPFPRALAERLDAIVNLAGAPIGPGRWTAARKRRILESRLAPTAAVAEVIGHGPVVLLNGSAVGIYGDAPGPLDERSPVGAGFLAATCASWEAAAAAAAPRGRVVLLRSGLVLATDGGILPSLARAGRLGVLGPVGSGNQLWPWIHVDDEVRAILHCLDHDVAGPVNLVAPRAAPQRVVAAAISRRVGRPSIVAVPAAAVRLGLGEAAALLLDGQGAEPAALAAAGFVHRHPDLEGALDDLL